MQVPTIGALARGGAATALAATLTGSIALSAASPARAESLDSQQQRLQQAIAESRTALGRDDLVTERAQDSLDGSRQQLAERRQVLANATDAWHRAQADDARMAGRLKASQAALSAATARVAAGQKELDKALDLAHASLSNLQQASPLAGVSVLTTPASAGEVNQQQQWSEVAAASTRATAARLTQLEQQLKAARQAQQQATAQVAQQRAQAASHLAETQRLRQAAQDDQAAVASQVRQDSAALAAANDALAHQRDRQSSLKAQAASVARQIEAARRAAAAAAAAKRRAAQLAAQKRARELAARRARLLAEQKAAAEAQARAARQAAQAAAARRAAAAEQARLQARAQARAARAAAAVRAAASAEQASQQSAATTATVVSHTTSVAHTTRPVAQPVVQQYSASPVGTSGAWDASSRYLTRIGGSQVDPWGFYSYECVSFAAFMVRTTTGYGGFQNNYTLHGTSAHFGNAVEWAAAAQDLGITVDTTPAVGSIAWRSTGRAGHVAYVTAVHDDGTIDIAEYNFGTYHGFGQRTHVYWRGGSSSGFDGFIHFERS